MADQDCSGTNTEVTERAFLQRKYRGPVSIFLLSVLVGAVGGLGAVVFRDLIALFHNLLLLGKWSVVYDANVHTPASPWGGFVILAPVLGSLGVTFLVRTFAPEAEGHGVPEVMDAIYYHKGVIRPVVAVIKSLASALSIGSGGSVGREGPIVQIGSAFGSSIGQWLQLPLSQCITLIAAGAGSGIAATFNTPIGGVLFAVEIMMHKVSAKTLVPVMISTATATYIGRLFLGSHPSFVIPSLEILYFHITKPLVLLAYVGLGLILGVVAALYIQSIYYFEDLFQRWIKRRHYVRHMIGMLLVGTIFSLLKLTTGHYYVEGVGYATIQDVLSGGLASILLLSALFVLKLLVTALTLGSGASGGIFSPALYLGTTVGGVYGLVLARLFPGLDISPAAFAVAGMAGVVGGSTGAAMTAIVMIFEMTLDYTVIIPVTITVALSYGIRKILCQESIYTLKLVRRGHHVPDALRTNFHGMRQAQDLMSTSFAVVPPSSTFKELSSNASPTASTLYYLIEDAQGVAGVLSREMVRNAAAHGGQEMTLSEIADRNYITAPGDASLEEVMARMRAKGASVALVTRGRGAVSAPEVQGVITAARIVETLAETTEMYSD